MVEKERLEKERLEKERLQEEEKVKIQKEKDRALKERFKSVVELLKETYYPGHATTARRVIERHLIREFGLKPRQATYHGAAIIELFQEHELIQPLPEVDANGQPFTKKKGPLLKINIRKLQAYKT